MRIFFRFRSVAQVRILVAVESVAMGDLCGDAVDGEVHLPPATTLASKPRLAPVSFLCVFSLLVPFAIPSIPAAAFYPLCNVTVSMRIG